MSYRFISGFVFLFLILILPQQPSYAATFNVTCNTTDLTNTVTIANANAEPDTVNLDPGCTYTLSSTLTIEADGGNALTLNGNGAILDGISIVNQGTLTINDLTVSNGSATYGGGIGNGGALALNNSTINGNTGTYGGGIFNTGTLSINNSTINGNTADYGGGIGTSGTSTLTINNSSISDNTASNQGGGIANFGTLTMGGSCISGNTTGAGQDVQHDDLYHQLNNAANNWWGAADGPSGAGPGSGDSVNGDVNYTPFLTAPPPACSMAGGGTSGNASLPTPPDDRINWQHGDTDAVVYPAQDDAGNPALHVYCLDAAGNAFLGLNVTQDDIDAYPAQPDTNVEVARNDDCPVSFHILTTGEYQVNIGPDAEGQVREVIFTGLPPSDVYFDDFNVYGGS